MNERIKQLALKAYNNAGQGTPDELSLFMQVYSEKFAELIVQECANAVLSVPSYYKDYRSQIEETVINDCARAVHEHFGVE